MHGKNLPGLVQHQVCERKAVIGAQHRGAAMHRVVHHHIVTLQAVAEIPPRC